MPLYGSFDIARASLGGTMRITATALAATALAGCGSLAYGGARGGAGASRAGSVPSAHLLDGVPAAAARTLGQRALIGWRLNGAHVFGPARAPVFGQGGFDFKAETGHETIDLPELRRQELGNEHAIFLPTEVYLQPRAPGLTVLPRGKKWLAASLVGSESLNTNFPQFVAQVEGVNPMLPLAELEWGATASIRLGTGRQIVDHVAAVRYRVTVDLERAIARAGGPLGNVLSQAIEEQLTADRAARRFQMLTWVDHQRRVVQIQAKLPGTGEGTELLAISYFGSPVSVTAPKRSLVVDISSLTPSGERENNGGGDSDGG